MHRLFPCRDFSLCAVAAVVVAWAITARAADKPGVYTDPADAGPDYAVQGEYVGTIDGKPVGAQVVALGNGKFDLVLFHGGLPGAGWKRGDKSDKAGGATKDGVTTFASNALNATLKDGVITLDKGELRKTDRKSPTLGAKPPAGAVVLFDGKANDFQPGDVTDGGDLMALAKGGQRSKTAFGGKDVTLHLEFRTPFQPAARGQGRGNSGVYLPGGKEVQVLDSFGLEGKNNECGGFYSHREPDVNMCLPPLQWQTYDIEITAARRDDKGKVTAPAKVTVIHNGVVIHKDYDLGDLKAGTLFLQNHGNPVVYRNIWIVEK